jgi:queuine tRNA-ribosyltransferase
LEPEPHKKIKLDMRKPLTFNILKTYNTARASILNLPHGDVKTPVYMPVGTKGAMKGTNVQF